MLLLHMTLRHVDHEAVFCLVSHVTETVDTTPTTLQHLSLHKEGGPEFPMGFQHRLTTMYWSKQAHLIEEHDLVSLIKKFVHTSNKRHNPVDSTYTTIRYRNVHMDMFLKEYSELFSFLYPLYGMCYYHRQGF